MPTNEHSVFLNVYTEHYAEIGWYFDEHHVRNIDYHIAVSDAVNAHIKVLMKKYAIEEDTSYCTQFEGVLLVSSSLQDVQAAGQELAEFMTRFDGIVPIFD